MQKIITLLIEPILIPKIPLIRRNLIKKRSTKAITETLINNNLIIRITNLSSDTIKELSIASIRIHAEKLNYERTFSSNIPIGEIQPKAFFDIDKSKILFPVPGLYWLDVDIRTVFRKKYLKLQFKQRMLEGIIGDGDTKFDPNICRNPIGVVDNLSAKLDTYTRIILWLTVLMSLIATIKFLI